MAGPVDKRALLAELLSRLRADLDAVTESQSNMQGAATHDEARPESDKDTRATESSYIARGLAERVVQLRAAVAALARLTPGPTDPSAPVGIGALATLEDDDGAEQFVWLLPAVAGEKLTAAERTIAVVTPTSPLGRAMVGASEGDDIEAPRRGQRRVLSITSIE